MSSWFRNMFRAPPEKNLITDDLDNFLVGRPKNNAMSEKPKYNYGNTFKIGDFVVSRDEKEKKYAGVRGKVSNINNNDVDLIDIYGKTHTKKFFSLRKSTEAETYVMTDEDFQDNLEKDPEFRETYKNIYNSFGELKSTMTSYGNSQAHSMAEYHQMERDHNNQNAGKPVRKSLDKCTVDELKTRAAKRGIKVTGLKKAEIIAKLRK